MPEHKKSSYFYAKIIKINQQKINRKNNQGKIT